VLRSGQREDGTFQELLDLSEIVVMKAGRALISVNV
jgi:hypothetical protein